MLWSARETVSAELIASRAPLAPAVAAPATVLVPILYWPYTYVSTQAYVLQSGSVVLLLLEVMLSTASFISYH